jgi:hypothetical protein
LTLLEFGGIVVSHEVLINPKLSGYELPAISKHNVTASWQNNKQFLKIK